MASYDWIIGLSLMFGLALAMNKYTFENLSGFFIFLTIFNSFVVWGGLLPLWCLILNIVFLTLIIYSEIKKRSFD